MTTFIEQARLYAVFHQKPLNRYLQMIGILLIYLAAMSILAAVHIAMPDIFSVSLAYITTLALIIYYVRLNWLLALIITPILLLLCWIADAFVTPTPTLFTLWFFLVTAVLGAAMYFTGYILEGKRPDLKDNLQQLLIAPLMIATDLLFLAGRKRDLKEEIYGKQGH